MREQRRRALLTRQPSLLSLHTTHPAPQHFKSGIPIWTQPACWTLGSANPESQTGSSALCSAWTRTGRAWASRTRARSSCGERLGARAGECDKEAARMATEAKLAAKHRDALKSAGAPAPAERHASSGLTLCVTPGHPSVILCALGVLSGSAVCELLCRPRGDRRYVASLALGARIGGVSSWSRFGPAGDTPAATAPCTPVGSWRSRPGRCPGRCQRRRSGRNARRCRRSLDPACRT